MIGMASQSLLYLVDTAMLGYLGSEALAAVAISEFTALLCYGFVTGIAHGVQACVSQWKGRGRETELAFPLNEGIVLSVLIGTLIAVALTGSAETIFALQTQDENVRALGIPYLQIQLLVTAFVGINFSFRSYWNGIDRPGIAVFVQIAVVTINIPLNYLLIFGNWGFPELGVTGAGLGTAIAIACGSLIYFVIGMRLAKRNGFMAAAPSLARLRSLQWLSLPACIQTCLLYAGIMMLVWIIGRVGTPELAAANVIMKITMVVVLPSFALGAAAATLVGLARGRGDNRDAKCWGWNVTAVSLIVIGLLGLPLVLAPDWVLGIFIHDSHTLEIARLPAQLAGISMGLEGAQFVLMNALIGAGDTRWPMLISSVTQWLVFLPLCYVFGVELGFGLLGIWIVVTLHRPLVMFIYSYIWQRGQWARLEI